LFQIITLSKALANGTHGSRYNNLPDYLAVSPDLDIFAELTHLDILKCRSFDKQVCMFHTGFAKRGSRKSCAVALFTNDETHVREYCQTLFISWNGPEAVYLGKNQWAFSAVGPHTVVFSCPPDSKHLPPQRRQLPSVGYLEVPPGCTARTDHWILPASFEGSTMLEAVSVPLPQFPELRPNITAGKAATVVFFPSMNDTHLDKVSALLSQQTSVEVQASMTHNQIVTLLESKEMSSAHPCAYPYEWIAAFAFLSLCFGGLSGFTWWLFRQLSDHIRCSSGIYDVADYVPAVRRLEPIRASCASL
jgi:hypothetical protein